MISQIIEIKEKDHQFWDSYVTRSHDANIYQLFSWRSVISSTYGHKPYYLAAIRGNGHSKGAGDLVRQGALTSQSAIAGILPLFHIKHFIFGNQLVSMPFFDHGGILADDFETEKALLHEAIKIGRKLKVQHIELRHLTPLKFQFDESSPFKERDQNRPACGSDPGSTLLTADGTQLMTLDHKSRMLLKLPGQADHLFKAFKSKLRSQIKVPMKAGLTTKAGGLELLSDFYRVFSQNMRDLGSPVHSRQLMENVLKHFQQTAIIFVVYQRKAPLAASLCLGFNDTLVNPWASALRKYNSLSPNMLLYWNMLAYACDRGYHYFDFGRSTVGEGTYRFKKQWGADAFPMYWHRLSYGGPRNEHEADQKKKFTSAIQFWRNLPLGVTLRLGPYIRKYIAL